MIICTKCGGEITKEESMERYLELQRKYGIVPMMMPICKVCRELPEDTSNWIAKKVSK